MSDSLSLHGREGAECEEMDVYEAKSKRREAAPEAKR